RGAEVAEKTVSAARLQVVRVQLEVPGSLSVSALNNPSGRRARHAWSSFRSFAEMEDAGASLPLQCQLHHFPGTEKPKGQSRETKPAVDDELGVADLVDAAAQAAGERVVADDRAAVGLADLPAVGVAREHDVGAQRGDLPQVVREM